MDGLERRLQHLRSLAETHLNAYDPDDAVQALKEIENCTQADLPDDLLVKAARRYLEEENTLEFIGPSAILHEVLFDV